MRIGVLLLALFAVCSGCQTPPPASFVAGGTTHQDGVAVGTNTVGENCLQLPESGGADIFCGAWKQPSARIRSGGAATGRQVMQLAGSSVWRNEIDGQFACAEPSPTTMLDGAPAAVMQCTRRFGGWPQVAMVAEVNGTIWYADGVQPAIPAIQRSIGLLSGKLKPDSATGPSGLDALIADRVAARAFTSSDIRDYYELMVRGKRANLADNPASAETAYRAALTVQEKVLGRDSPETATVLMSLALQLSNQSQFSEADRYFAKAAQLAPTSTDRTAMARLSHYLGLHALNQHQPEDAKRLLEDAEARYVLLLPEGASVRPDSIGPQSAQGGTLVDEAVLTDLFATDTMKQARLGILEARRNRAIALRELGDVAGSEQAARSTEAFAASGGLAVPAYMARLYRTTGVSAEANGDTRGAETQLASASRAFVSLLPESRPIADTNLRLAALQMGNDQVSDALATCRTAIRLLRDLGAGADASQLKPCLKAYATTAEQTQGDRQAVLNDMFIMSQLVRSGVTSQQIQQAAARLSENARDPRVGEAIRHREDAQRTLTDLIRTRDAMGGSEANPGISASRSSRTNRVETDLIRAGGGAAQAPASQGGDDNAAGLDARIEAAQAALADADAALQAASPNYGQLVQQVVTADAVFAALRPDEALVAITLADDADYVFVLRDHKISLTVTDNGLSRIATLVRRLRTGVERRSSTLPRFDFAAANELYRVTLGSAEKDLDGVKALVVVPSGPLLSVPFETLLTGPADASDYAGAPWLVKRFTISHTPAITNFVELRKIAGGSRAAHPWFGFGDFQPPTLAQATRSFPDASCAGSAKRFADLPRLEGTRAELDAARAIFGAQRDEELLGPAFTAAAVRALPLKQYRILHFAAHALLPSELNCQNQPAIVTSAPAGAVDISGALLDSSQIANLNLDAEAIILSACNTGGAGNGAAESLSGLARSFFYAGSRSLMVTHWDTDDQTAAKLVAATLRNLREAPHDGIAGALTRAQLDYLADPAIDPFFKHPTFWAPFAVIGEGGGTGQGLRAEAGTGLPGATSPSTR